MEESEEFSEFNLFIERVQDAILNPIITLLALGAFLLFVWGVVIFIGSAGDEEKRSIGKRHMVWGIVGLVILFGAWGVVTFLKSIITGFVPA